MMQHHLPSVKTLLDSMKTPARSSDLHRSPTVADIGLMSDLGSETFMQWMRAVSVHTSKPIASDTNHSAALLTHRTPCEEVQAGHKRKACDEWEENRCKASCTARERTPSVSPVQTPPERPDPELKYAEILAALARKSEDWQERETKDSCSDEASALYSEAAAQQRHFMQDFEAELRSCVMDGASVCNRLEASLLSYSHSAPDANSGIAKQVSDLAQLCSKSRRLWELYDSK